MTSMLPQVSPSFCVLSNMVSTTRRVLTSITDLAKCRHKRLVSLITVYNHSPLGTRTPLTGQMQAPIANHNVDIPVSRHSASTPLSLTTMSTFQRSSSTWLPFQIVLPSLAYLGLSHNKRAARDTDLYFPTSVANPTNHSTGTTLASIRRQRHTIDTTLA